MHFRIYFLPLVHCLGAFTGELPANVLHVLQHGVEALWYHRLMGPNPAKTLIQENQLKVD